MKQALTLLALGLGLMTTACAKQKLSPSSMGPSPHTDAQRLVADFDVLDLASLTLSQSGGYPHPFGSCYANKLQMEFNDPAAPSYIVSDSCGKTCRAALSPNDIEMLKIELRETYMGQSLSCISDASNSYLSLLSRSGETSTYLLAGSGDAYKQNVLFAEKLTTHLYQLWDACRIK